MSDLIDDPIVSAAIGLLILCGMSAIAFYVVSKFRDYDDQDQDHEYELLANLQEMRVNGDITEEEYRTINSATHPQLKRGMSDGESTSQETGAQNQTTSPNPLQS